MKQPDDNDFHVMAQTIFGEARGAPPTDDPGVAWTIINRWKSGKWFAAASLAGVCIKRMQYSCWNVNDPTYRRMVNATKDELAPFEKIARDCVAGTIPDPTGGATHYYADSIAAPKWAIGKTPTVKLGHHLFFSDID